jgi:hypothetical protein
MVNSENWGGPMKVLAIIRLRNASHAEMREGLESFKKHGTPGMEESWFSADGRTVVLISEVDDVADLHKYSSFYAPYIEATETHVVSNASAGVANMSAGLDLAP